MEYDDEQTFLIERRIEARGRRRPRWKQVGVITGWSEAEAVKDWRDFAEEDRDAELRATVQPPGVQFVEGDEMQCPFCRGGVLNIPARQELLHTDPECSQFRELVQAGGGSTGHFVLVKR